MTKGCVFPYYIKDGKTYGLFGLRSDNRLYDVFGGAADRLESVESTASRELLEETSKALEISPRTLNKAVKLRPVDYAIVYLIEMNESQIKEVINTHNHNLSNFRLRKQIERTEMTSLACIDIHQFDQNADDNLNAQREDLTDFSKLTIQAYLNYKNK
jgi:hypothetical protein